MSHSESAGAAVWVRQKERSNMLMLRLMSWISLRLGRAVSRGVLLGISLYFVLFARGARLASRAYLGVCWAGRSG
jgi:predicted LPLAT superfamily acyltransferase